MGIKYSLVVTWILYNELYSEIFEAKKAIVEANEAMGNSRIMVKGNG